MSKSDAPKYDSPRQLGRVDDVTWKQIKDGAVDAGESFTAWAVSVLLAAAKKQAKNKRKNCIDKSTRAD